MPVTIQTPEVYLVNGAHVYVQPPTFVADRVPTSSDTGPIGATWLNEVTQIQYVLVKNTGSATPNVWVIDAAPSQFVGLTDTNGTQVVPNGSGNIQLVGDTTSGITVTSNPGSHLLTIANANRSDVTTTTTDATPTAIQTYAIPTNSSIVVNATILGSKADFSNSLGLIITRTFRRAGAGAATCGATVQQALCSDAPGGVTADLTLVGNSAALVVTGEAATTYNWVATFEYIKLPA